VRGIVACIGTREASVFVDWIGGAVAGRMTGEGGSMSIDSGLLVGPCWCFFDGMTVRNHKSTLATKTSV